MSKGNGNVVSVKILANDSTSSLHGKLADAEVLFEAGAGPLAGLGSPASPSHSGAPAVAT